MSTILLIILVLLLVGALPAWPYSRGWGYYPSGGLGLVVVVLLVCFCSPDGYKRRFLSAGGRCNNFAPFSFFFCNEKLH